MMMIALVEINGGEVLGWDVLSHLSVLSADG